jgi:hypothetical protein
MDSAIPAATEELSGRLRAIVARELVALETAERPE